jgi:hypothetical protein
VDSKLNNAKSGHLITIEVQLNEISNGIALEKLLQLLNRSDDVVDYKIVSRVELGRPLDAKPLNDNQEKPPAKAAFMRATPSIVEQFELLKKQNRLVRLTIVKGQGFRFDLPCRIIHCDSAEDTVTVYHVDDKKVYTFNLSEVEHISVA